MKVFENRVLRETFGVKEGTSEEKTSHFNVSLTRLIQSTLSSSISLIPI
jgi:hypothetical protein